MRPLAADWQDSLRFTFVVDVAAAVARASSEPGELDSAVAMRDPVALCVGDGVVACSRLSLRRFQPRRGSVPWVRARGKDGEDVRARYQGEEEVSMGMCGRHGLD